MSAQTTRMHHYLFAHKALTQMALQGPPKMLDLLSTPMGTPFLLDMWESVGKDLEKAQRMEPDGLGCESRQLDGGRKVVVVRMPPPQSATEAYFVGILIKPESRKMLVFKEPAQVRYLTLELGASMDGQARTVLCEWTTDGSHVNMGDGPAPNLDAFVDAVSKL